MDLHAKLNLEILVFTIVQFSTFLVGGLAMLLFYVKHRDQTKWLIAMVLTFVMVLWLAGLCNFFIHRNGAYMALLQNTVEAAKEMQQYEVAKMSHRFNILVAMSMVVFTVLGWMVYYVLIATCSLSRWTKVILFLILAFSSCVFLLGGTLGRVGW